MDDLALSGNSLNLALSQLPSRLRQALRQFRKITGLTAVARLTSSLSEEGVLPALAPPIHPQCTKRLRGVVNPPCSEQWQRHLRQSRESARIHSHLCSLGLRCACVTIRVDGRPVGIAKLVVGPDTPDRAVAAAASTLEIVVSSVCQDLLNTGLRQDLETLQRRVASLLLANERRIPSTGGPGKAACAPPGPEMQSGRSSLVQRAASCLQRRYPEQGLSIEVEALRQCVAKLQQIRSKGEPRDSGPGQPVTAPGPEKAEGGNGALVERTLAYLQQHYQEPNLSLSVVAKALGCNPRYLTSRYTQIVGAHMHRHLLGLRLAHACRLLMGSELPIKEISHVSGFHRPALLTRSFQGHVGVSPTEYRRIFGAPRLPSRAVDPNPTP